MIRHIVKELKDLVSPQKAANGENQSEQFSGFETIFDIIIISVRLSSFKY